MQVELTQGTEAWHAFRLSHFGASEAAAMLGLSKKVKRSELLAMKATGSAKEFSNWVQENILDHGHRVEALARPLVEEDIGDDLYPETHEADLLPPWCEFLLSASLDGITMDGRIAFEHKQWAEALAASVSDGVLPEEHMPQCQQLMLVTGAEKVVFTVSDGTRERMVCMDVLPDPAWQERIRAGWTQFAIDLAEYEHVEVLPAAVAAPRMDLPALMIQVNGALTLNSNLTVWGVQLTEFIDGINLTPSNDQDFADAEDAVKKLEKAESNLAAAESNALAQVASVDEMVRMVAMYKKLARDTRLMMEKVIKARKETVRVEIQQDAKDKKDAHQKALNERLGGQYMPDIAADFAAAMKGKKTPSSLKDAASTELARYKIEANAVADRIQLNLNTLTESGAEYAFLFADKQAIVLKMPDDFKLLVTSRIDAHKAAEAAKAESERARIREEERVKAEAAAAETLRQQQAEAARATAQREAEERARAAADTQRQLDEQAARIAAERAAEKTAVPASVDPEAARQAAFYGEAAPSRTSQLQALADQHLADGRGTAQVARAAGLPTSSFRPSADALFDAVTDAGPTDKDLLDFCEEHDMQPEEMLVRFERFVADVSAGRVLATA